MFDNLRQASEHSDIFEEPIEEEPKVTRRRPESRFLGMTAAQRFLLSLMLFAAVIVIGVMCLVVFQRIYF